MSTFRQSTVGVVADPFDVVHEVAGRFVNAGNVEVPVAVFWQLMVSPPTGPLFGVQRAVFLNVAAELVAGSMVRQVMVLPVASGDGLVAVHVPAFTNPLSVEPQAVTDSPGAVGFTHVGSAIGTLLAIMPLPQDVITPEPLVLGRPEHEAAGKLVVSDTELQLVATPELLGLPKPPLRVVPPGQELAVTLVVCGVERHSVVTAPEVPAGQGSAPV